MAFEVDFKDAYLDVLVKVDNFGRVVDSAVGHL